jgi:hypothetical protein
MIGYQPQESFAVVKANTINMKYSGAPSLRTKSVTSGANKVISTVALVSPSDARGLASLDSGLAARHGHWRSVWLYSSRRHRNSYIFKLCEQEEMT